jgi:hypothetical protein
MGNMSREEASKFARDWQEQAEASGEHMYKGNKLKLSVECTPRRKTLVRNIFRAKDELERLKVPAGAWAECGRTLSIYSKDGHTCVGRTQAKGDGWEWMPGGLEKLGVAAADVPTQMEVTAW